VAKFTDAGDSVKLADDGAMESKYMPTLPRVFD
jgi:hypothetical protein